MSQVKIQGDPSGTGIFTIASPNSNSNVNFTLPTTSGTLFTNPNGAIDVNAAAPASSLAIGATGAITSSSTIKSNSGGFVFPDNTTQTTAAAPPSPNVQTFNSTATWTKSTGGQTMARIQVWGGGGGGGRSASASNSSSGGGGGYNEITVPISYLAATVTATVGSGGAGATSAGSGGTGGTSSFALATAFMGRSSVDAYGGAGGTAGTNLAGGGGQLSAGGTGTFGQPRGGNNNWFGGAGGYSSGCLTISGEGVLFGGGGGGVNGTGTTAGTSLYGGAGGLGGAGTQPAGGGGSSANSNTNGGSGAAGRIIVTCW